MNIAADIEFYEKQLRQAMLDGDAVILNRLLSDTLIFTNQYGVRLTKDDDLAAYRSGVLAIEKLDVAGEPIVHVVGDTAIVSTIVELAGRYAEVSFSGKFAYTRVWHRSVKEWRVHAGHCSAVAD